MDIFYLRDLSTLLLFTFTSITLIVALFFVSRLFRPFLPSANKLTAYECGNEPIGNSWVQFNVRYYIFAFLFVIFDVETVYLFPWALGAKQLGIVPLFAVLFFLAVLLLGLFYAYKKGVLKWI